jgi:hypothetical protein
MALMNPTPQARHDLAVLVPPWTGGSQARPRAYSFVTEGLFTVYDVSAEQWWQSLLARFPSAAPADALPYLARERRLFVGPSEPTATTRVRVRNWIDEWSLSGLPLGWLLAVQAYFAPTYPRVRIVTRRSMWYTLEEGAVGRLLSLDGYEPLSPCPYELGANWPIGAVASPIERLRTSGLFTRHKAPVANWDWDSISTPGNAGRWWDFWAFVYPPAVAQQGKYDGAAPDDVYYGEESGWGLDELPGTLFVLRLLGVQRKPAKAYLGAIIFPPSLTDFDPTTAPGDPNFPDGYWSAATKIVGGVAMPTRRDDCRYILNIAQ